MRTTASAMMALALWVAPADAAKPERVTILKGDERQSVLRQCSRPTPGPGEGWFEPTRSQITTLDTLVGRRVAAARGGAKPLGMDGIVGTYAVEAVGIVRGGRRHVYGNYYPLRMQEGVKNHDVPTIICDGGANFIGAEMDVTTGRLTHYATNGR